MIMILSPYVELNVPHFTRLKKTMQSKVEINQSSTFRGSEQGAKFLGRSEFKLFFEKNRSQSVRGR